MAEKRYTWQVEGTVPVPAVEGSENPARPGRPAYNENINMQVIATTLESAIEAVRAKFPDVVLHKCWRDRWIKHVIVVAPDDGSDEGSTDGND